MASIDDDARPFLEISSDHQCVADRTTPIFDCAFSRIAAVDPRRRRLGVRFPVSRRGSCSIDEQAEAILRCPESEAFRTLVDFETTHFARNHPTLTTWTAKFCHHGWGRFGIERHPTTQTESGIIQISRVAFGADQATAIDCGDDARPAIGAQFYVGPGDRTTSRTSTEEGIGRLWWRRVERRTTTTIKRSIRHHRADVELRMTIWTGDELQAGLQGPYRTDPGRA